MPTYAKASGSVGPKLLTGSLTPNGVFGSSATLPDAPAANFAFAAANAALAFDLIGYKDGTATAAPVTFDLAALTDIYGNTINWLRVKAISWENFNPNDGVNLLVDLTVSNAWKAAVNGIATAKLTIPCGVTDPASGQVVPGGMLIWAPNLTGLVTSGTSKVVTLDPGAATIPFRMKLLGSDY